MQLVLYCQHHWRFWFWMHLWEFHLHWGHIGLIKSQAAVPIFESNWKLTWTTKKTTLNLKMTEGASEKVFHGVGIGYGAFPLRKHVRHRLVIRRASRREHTHNRYHFTMQPPGRMHLTPFQCPSGQCDSSRSTYVKDSLIEYSRPQNEEVYNRERTLTGQKPGKIWSHNRWNEEHCNKEQVTKQQENGQEPSCWVNHHSSWLEFVVEMGIQILVGKWWMVIEWWMSIEQAEGKIRQWWKVTQHTTWLLTWQYTFQADLNFTTCIMVIDGISIWEDTGTLPSGSCTINKWFPTSMVQYGFP